MFRIAGSAAISVLWMLVVKPCSAAAIEPIEKLVCDTLPQIRTNAEHSDARAQSTLAKLYLEGHCGLGRDYVQAARWAKLSAEQGNAQGEGLFGFMLAQGVGTPKDNVEALKLLKLSAEQGDIPGTDYLALMFHHGWGTPRDDVEALKWARLSAEHGDAQGESIVALLLLGGRGVPRDDIAAAKWAKLSAEQDNSGGQMLLAAMYRDGRGGLPKDCVEAEKWYILAGRSGDVDAFGQKLNESRMSAGEIIEARQRAHVWKPEESVRFQPK